MAFNRRDVNLQVKVSDFTNISDRSPIDTGPTTTKKTVGHGDLMNSKDLELTFMSAFESSPVHCLKPRPCGKRRNPGKDGTRAILQVWLIKIFAPETLMLPTYR
jgi:hypothetical protein